MNGYDGFSNYFSMGLCYQQDESVPDKMTPSEKEREMFNEHWEKMTKERDAKLDPMQYLHLLWMLVSGRVF